ncbi:cytochrome c oxidase subunit I, partial [bacterium]
MATSAVLAGAEPDFYHTVTKRKGILSWILTTDHKRIGILYLGTILLFFFAAVALGFLMRLEMLRPEGTLMEPQTYNTFFTLHGIIMIFLFVIPIVP